MLLLPKVVKSPSSSRKLTPACVCGCDICKIAWSGRAHGQSGVWDNLAEQHNQRKRTHTILIIKTNQTMKSMTKYELADAAGVSAATFRRWLKTDRAFLEANHIHPRTKILPPKVVKYLCEKYCIEVC